MEDVIPTEPGKGSGCGVCKLLFDGKDKSMKKKWAKHEIKTVVMQSICIAAKCGAMYEPLTPSKIGSWLDADDLDTFYDRVQFVCEVVLPSERAALDSVDKVVDAVWEALPEERRQLPVSLRSIVMAIWSRTTRATGRK